MNEDHQPIIIPAQAQLSDAGAPKPRHGFWQITGGPEANPKTLAIREHIKQHGGLIFNCKAETVNDALELDGAGGAQNGPSGKETFALGEGVVMNPAGSDHAVKDAREHGIHLGAGEHAGCGESSGPTKGVNS